MIPESKSVVLLPNEGKEISVGNSKLMVKLLSEATGNALTITEYELAPQFPVRLPISIRYLNMPGIYWKVALRFS